jgi:hypothetical protein
MSLPAPPEYIDTLSEEQREKLYDFVEVTHQVLDGASF